VWISEHALGPGERRAAQRVSGVVSVKECAEVLCVPFKSSVEVPYLATRPSTLGPSVRKGVITQRLPAEEVCHLLLAAAAAAGPGRGRVSLPGHPPRDTASLAQLASTAGMMELPETRLRHR
jgi:hypothetical protein